MLEVGRIGEFELVGDSEMKFLMVLRTSISCMGLNAFRSTYVSLKEALGLGNVKTLILSRSAVLPCLSALNKDPGASDHTRWFSSMHTLIIHPDSDQDLRYLHDYLYDLVFPRFLSIAQGKKVAGSPFGSVSLFIRGANPRWRLDPVLEELRCVGELEVVLGDDVLDWDIDKYFLDGLDHLQKNGDVEWYQDCMYAE